MIFTPSLRTVVRYAAHRRRYAHGHEPFEAQIRAHPDNPAPKLVYADHLEEMGHPAGEGIRLAVAHGHWPWTGHGRHEFASSRVAENHDASYALHDHLMMAMPANFPDESYTIRQFPSLPDALAAYGQAHAGYAAADPEGYRRWSFATRGRPFEAAIRADPHNPDPKLAYAEWLEQQGHPGVEHVRLAVAKGHWPAFGGDRWMPHDWVFRDRTRTSLGNPNAAYILPKALFGSFAGWEPNNYGALGFPSLLDALAAYHEATQRLHGGPPRRESRVRRYSSEQAFHQAIYDHPDNPQPKLVYADYLDERGHPGGEYLRLMDEAKKAVPLVSQMAPTSPHSDWVRLTRTGLSPVRKWAPGMARSLAILAFHQPPMRPHPGEKILEHVDLPEAHRALAAAELHAAGLIGDEELGRHRQALQDAHTAQAASREPWTWRAPVHHSNVAMMRALNENPYHAALTQGTSDDPHTWGALHRLSYAWTTYNPDNVLNHRQKQAALVRWLGSNNKLPARLRAVTRHLAAMPRG